MRRDSNPYDHLSTRRNLLKRIGAGTLAATATAGCVSSDGISSGATTTGPGQVGFALSTAGSGPYLNIGREERRGFELAVQHLNEGGGLVDEGVFAGIGGNGVLGRTVDGFTFESGDASKADSQLATRLAEGDLAMFSGGVSGDVVESHRSLADEHGVPYMAGASLLSSLTGSDCSPHVYREQFSSDAVMRALGPTLESEFGESATYQQLYVDAVEGADMIRSVRTYFGADDAPDWETTGTIQIRKGTTEMERVFETIDEMEPDVVFCHLFGLDATNFVKAASDRLPDGTGVVVPWINQSMAGVLQENVEGVVGTTTWDPGFKSWRSKVFAEAYREEYGGQDGAGSAGATGPAHLVYGQTLSFASAAEQAGSFDADAVRQELEGATYNVGLGDETLQACNHQATRSIPVVRGRAEQSSDGSWFDLLTVEDDAVATCGQQPASECSL